MSNLTAAADSKSDLFFQPRRLGHVNLFVSDYVKSAEFYNRIVGFEEVYRQPDNRAAFMSNGNTYHDLGLTETSSKYAVPGQKPGLWHLALELETELDLVDGYKRAERSGVRFDFVMDHDVARSAYLTDPDGNMVEMYADVEKDWRPLRSGIIIKDKPKWIPGVTSAPLTEKNYPEDPPIVVVYDAVFHPRKIAHVALVAEHFEEMFDYYTDVVGMQSLTGNRASPFAVLQGAVGEGDLTLYRKSEGRPPGLHHVGFEVWSEDDLRKSTSALAAAGVTVERSVDHPARVSVTIKDPDGLLLQFFVNRNWTAEQLASLDAETALHLL